MARHMRAIDGTESYLERDRSYAQFQEAFHAFFGDEPASNLARSSDECALRRY